MHHSAWVLPLSLCYFTRSIIHHTSLQQAARCVASPRVSTCLRGQISSGGGAQMVAPASDLLTARQWRPAKARGSPSKNWAQDAEIKRPRRYSALLPFAICHLTWSPKSCSHQEKVLATAVPSSLPSSSVFHSRAPANRKTGSELPNATPHPVNQPHPSYSHPLFLPLVSRSCLCSEWGAGPLLCYITLSGSLTAS